MSTPSGLIAPHGGQLINRIASDAEKQEFLAQGDRLPRITLDARAQSDLEMIAIGGFSPLKGFMEQKDYELVVEEMHLSNGLPWSVPVTSPFPKKLLIPSKKAIGYALMMPTVALSVSSN